ncbi:MAG: hypothetical protein KAJ14_02300, partial [Candidatus Omnitrophica bacterium]|nr:hypothetical protein [Candidatus Omnitrophota bacterium]
MAVERTLFNVYNTAGEEGILICEPSLLKTVIRKQMKEGIPEKFVDELYLEYEKRYAGDLTIFDKLNKNGFGKKIVHAGPEDPYSDAIEAIIDKVLENISGEALRNQTEEEVKKLIHECLGKQSSLEIVKVLYLSCKEKAKLLYVSYLMDNIKEVSLNFSFQNPKQDIKGKIESKEYLWEVRKIRSLMHNLFEVHELIEFGMTDNSMVSVVLGDYCGFKPLEIENSSLVSRKSQAKIRRMLKGKGYYSNINGRVELAELFKEEIFNIFSVNRTWTGKLEKPEEKDGGMSDSMVETKVAGVQPMEELSSFISGVWSTASQNLFSYIEKERKKQLKTGKMGELVSPQVMGGVISYMDFKEIDAVNWDKISKSGNLELEKVSQKVLRSLISDKPRIRYMACLKIEELMLNEEYRPIALKIAEDLDAAGSIELPSILKIIKDDNSLERTKTDAFKEYLININKKPIDRSVLKMLEEIFEYIERPLLNIADDARQEEVMSDFIAVIKEGLFAVYNKKDTELLVNAFMKSRVFNIILLRFLTNRKEEEREKLLNLMSNVLNVLEEAKKQLDELGFKEDILHNVKRIVIDKINIGYLINNDFKHETIKDILSLTSIGTFVYLPDEENQLIIVPLTINKNWENMDSLSDKGIKILNEINNREEFQNQISDKLWEELCIEIDVINTEFEENVKLGENFSKVIIESANNLREEYPEESIDRACGVRIIRKSLEKYIGFKFSDKFIENFNKKINVPSFTAIFKNKEDMVFICVYFIKKYKELERKRLKQEEIETALLGRESNSPVKKMFSKIFISVCLFNLLYSFYVVGVVLNISLSYQMIIYVVIVLFIITYIELVLLRIVRSIKQGDIEETQELEEKIKALIEGEKSQIYLTTDFTGYSNEVKDLINRLKSVEKENITFLRPMEKNSKYSRDIRVIKLVPVLGMPYIDDGMPLDFLNLDQIEPWKEIEIKGYIISMKTFRKIVERIEKDYAKIKTKQAGNKILNGLLAVMTAGVIGSRVGFIDIASAEPNFVFNTVASEGSIPGILLSCFVVGLLVSMLRLKRLVKAMGIRAGPIVCKLAERLIKRSPLLVFLFSITKPSFFISKPIKIKKSEIKSEWIFKEGVYVKERYDGGTEVKDEDRRILSLVFEQFKDKYGQSPEGLLSEVVSKTGTIFKNEVKTIIRDNLDDDSQKQSVKFLYGIFEKWWGYNKELNKQIRDNGFIELSSIDIINLRIIESSGPLEERMLFITVKWHDPATSKVWKGNLAALSSLESSGFVVRDGFKRKGIQLTEFARMLLDLGLIKEKQVENKDGNKNKDIIIPSAEWNILNKIKSRKPLINLSDYSGEIKALIKRGLLKGGKDGSFEFTKKYYELFGEGKIRKGKKPQKSKTSDSISRGNIFCEFVKRVIENIIAGKKRTEIFKGINRWELQYTTGTAFNSAQKRVDVLLDDIIFELYEGEAVAQGINDVDIISEERAVGFNNLRDGLVQKIINRVKDLNVSLEQLFYVFTLILWGSIKNKSKEDIRFYSDSFPLIADEIVKKLGYSSKLIKENGRLFIVVLDNDKKYRFALKETFGMNNQQRALYMTDRRSADGGNKTDIAEYATIIYHGKKISEEEILIWISQERKYLDCLSDLKEEENECMWNESLKNTIINTTPGVKAFLNVFNHVGIINYWLRSGPEVIARLILGSFYIMVLVIFKGVEDPFMKFISIEFALILFVYMATCFMSIIKPAAMLGQKIIINSYFRISGKDLSYREYLQAVFGHEFIHQNAERLGIDKKGEYVLANAYKYLRFSKGEKEEIINMFLSLSGTHLDEVTKEKVKKEMTLFAFSLEDSNLKEIMEIGKIIASKGKNWERILRVFETLDTEHSFEIEFVAAICAITVSSLYQDNKLEAIKLLKYLSKGESLNTVGQWAKKERIRIDGNKPLRAIDRDGGAEEIEITWIKDSREMSNIGGRDLFVTRMVIQNSLFEKDHDLYHEIIQNLISDEKEKIVLNGVEGQYWYSTCFRHYYILIFKTNKGTNFIVFGVSEA